MHLFCIGHKPMAFDPGRPAIHVSPTRLPGAAPSLVIPDDRFGPAFDGKILSEYVQLFGLADDLTATDPSVLIYLFQYRKFTSLRPSEVPSLNQIWAHTTSAIGAAALFPTAAELQRLNGRPLLGPSVYVESLAANYAANHLEEDFLNFLAVLRHQPGFDLERCERFANCTHLLPAPSLGAVPLAVFKSQMAILKSAWGAFFPPFYQPRAGYQRRVGGFLLERLHSFLLWEDIASGVLANPVHGHQIVVSDSSLVGLTL